MIYRPILRVARAFTARSFLSSDAFSSESRIYSSLYDLPQPSTSAFYDVMVLHPNIRWGSASPSALKDPELQLAEAVALVNTLPGFKVIGGEIIGVDYSTKRKTIWGTGKISELLRDKHENGFSALMINVDMLTPIQQKELHNIFRVPIFDRYNIVLSIFKHYASTEEAHLQIQLAEIPYIKQRLHYMNKSTTNASVLHIEQEQIHSGVDHMEELRMREQDLRKRLREAVENRQKEITSTVKKTPQVAVVGYTNCGKTSLVKRLTGAESLNPENRLFATLDSTSHNAKLPSGRLTSFVDTVGFLSDLPAQLFAAFETTLAHVKHAEVIIHLRDASHPHWAAQSEDVIKTLNSIGLTEEDFDRVITVDNKIDRCSNYKPKQNCLAISCTTGSGVEELIKLLDLKILHALNCKPRRLNLSPSSPIISYLYSEGFVINEPKVDGDRLIFEIFMTDGEMAKMQKRIGILKKK